MIGLSPENPVDKPELLSLIRVQEILAEGFIWPRTE